MWSPDDAPEKPGTRNSSATLLVGAETRIGYGEKIMFKPLVVELPWYSAAEVRLQPAELPEKPE